MIPCAHHAHRETTVLPQARVQDLCAQEGALPEALRRQCLASGAALADDQAEPEGALFHAVALLSALGEARAVLLLRRCLARDDLFDGRAPQAAAALEGCLAA